MSIATEIEAALRQKLPAEFQGVALEMAQVFSKIATGEMSSVDAQTRLAAVPDLISALRALEGREVLVSKSLITFGAGNQIGDVTISGDIVGGNNVKITINYNQTVIKGNLSRRDHSNRERMLKLAILWIKGVLEQSLYQETLIALDLQTDPQALSSTGPRLAAVRDQKAQLLPHGTSITQAYQDANQRLLILGAPGAGKTTLLLDLTRHLLDEAQHDETQPIPVIFNLSSWSQWHPSLKRWLVQELCDQYKLSQRFAKQWLQENRILPLLDGLDEVAEPQRKGCVAAINAFMKEYGTEGIVVCSRSTDFLNLDAKLSLDMAVQVQPLDDTQIANYLHQAGAPLAGVKAVLDQNTELHELVRSPLLLNIMSLAYQDQRPEELLGLEAAAQRRCLFDRYVQRMFERLERNDSHRYTKEQTKRWLHWLAESLTQENRTIFQIEMMQPWWLRQWWQRGLYILFTSLGAGLGGAILGLCFTLLFGLIVGLMLEGMILLDSNSTILSTLHLFSPGDGLRSMLKINKQNTDDFIWPIYGLVYGLVYGFAVGLSVSLFQSITRQHHRWHSFAGAGLVAGFIMLASIFSTSEDPLYSIMLWSLSSPQVALITGVLILQRTIRPTEMLRWDWHTLRKRWYLGIVLALISSLGFGLGGGPISLCFGLGGGLISALVGGLTQTEFQAKDKKPNQGTWHSLRHSLRLWFVFGLSFQIVLVLVAETLVLGFNLMGGSDLMSKAIDGLIIGLLLGLVGVLGLAPTMSLYFGGLAFVQHFALRLVCTLCGTVPWHYARFLDYAVERILLRRVGGSYVFIHRMMLTYFAEAGENFDRNS